MTPSSNKCYVDRTTGERNKELNPLRCPCLLVLFLISPFSPNRNQQTFLKGGHDYLNQLWSVLQMQVFGKHEGYRTTALKPLGSS